MLIVRKFVQKNHEIYIFTPLRSILAKKGGSFVVFNHFWSKILKNVPPFPFWFFPHLVLSPSLWASPQRRLLGDANDAFASGSPAKDQPTGQNYPSCSKKMVNIWLLR
jgi:hypothetical protein